MMRKIRIQRDICFLLLLTMNFSAVAPAGAQEERRSERSGNLTTSVIFVPAAVPTPTPAPVTPSAPLATTPPPPAPKTVEELGARLQDVLRRPELAPAQVAVKIVSLDTGRTLFEENAGKRLMPASNMKIYTVAAALDRLSPDYRFKTSVYAPARPDATGTVRGDLTVYGRGDPSIAARFNDKNYNKGIDEIAARIVAAGVRKVEGGLVGDETYFTGGPLGDSWEWDDLQWWYGAEVSALSVNDNALDLFVKPGPSVGAPGLVTTGPTITSFVSVVNRTTTTPRGTKRDLIVHRGLTANIIEVGGSLPLDDKGYTGGVAVPHPALMFVEMLRSSLAQRGVTFTGRIRTLEASERGGITLNPFRSSSQMNATNNSASSLVEIASWQSPPLSLIAAQTLKPSQNLYAELLLRSLGKVFGNSTDPKQETAEAGIEVVKTFLREAGVSAEISMRDGSGLSRHSLITAEATVQLLTYMSRHRYANAFRDALPLAGVDGTLRNRFKGAPAANNVRAKTGTIDMVSALSGYATSAAGERLVFSIIINNVPGEASVRENYIDAMTILLASFTGKS
ncbi:MAG: D-alanyl-D-alanine carboxypeptidase/D-alanyl-D-alanine-endopeptidase [Acidobacteria bacterium]|nr:D-alanyl-D-alanine carboxypeptidase/D-alanyl-D-alanine-endopeptidase [Acidobacteriota bacterium]